MVRPPSREHYAFGRFRLAADATLLLDGEHPVRVAPKVLQTLLVLVERAGRVVTKDELMALVWPGTFVEETGLTRNISVLRAALGDDGDRAVVTVPRVGYRFALPVTSTTGPRPPVAHSGPPFVGRAAELRRLDAALEAACQGRGALIGLAGEPGIGKTTLAERLVAMAAERCVIGIGRSTDVLGTSEPHLPVLEALDMLASTPHVALTLRHHAPTWASHVRQTRSDAAAAPADTPERLLRELVHFLSALAREQPVLLVLDDMHWADAATTDVVTHLAGRLSDLPMLLLITYRDREFLPPGPPFARARAELLAKGVLREMALPLLSPQDVVHYVEQADPTHATAEIGAQVYASSEGNPLFMSALVAYLTSETSTPAAERTGQLPESLRGLIAQSLERLPSTHREILEAAAMQGYAFDAGTVATAVQRGELEVEDVLADTERMHGVIAHAEGGDLIEDGSGRYRFRHALYQAALLTHLTPSRRARLAAAMAEALRQRAGGDVQSVAGPVALLLEQARAYGRAAEQFAVASRRATERLAFRDASDLATRGMHCLERATDLGVQERKRIECALTFAQLTPLSSWRGYGHPAVDALTQRATRLAQELADPQATALALGMTCFVRLVRGECLASRDAARQLVVLAEAASHLPLVVNGHMQAQIACHHLGHFADADAHAAEVMRLGQALAPHERFMNVFDPLVASLAEASRNAWITGRLRRGIELAEHAVVLGAEVGNADSLAFAWLFHAWAHGYRGDWPTAVQSADHGIVVAKKNGTVQTLAWNQCVRGWARAHLGEVQDGRRQLEEGIDLSQSIMGEVALPQFRAMRAEVLLLQNASEQAQACLHEALLSSESHDDDYFAAELHRLAAVCNLPGPRGRSGEEYLWEALTIARAQGAALFEVRAAGTLLDRTGDPVPLKEALSRVAEPEPWPDIVNATARLRHS